MIALSSATELLECSSLDCFPLALVTTRIPSGIANEWMIISLGALANAARLKCQRSERYRRLYAPLRGPLRQYDVRLGNSEGLYAKAIRCFEVERSNDECNLGTQP